MHVFACSLIHLKFDKICLTFKHYFMKLHLKLPGKQMHFNQSHNCEYFMYSSTQSCAVELCCHVTTFRIHDFESNLTSLCRTLYDLSTGSKAIIV